MEASFNSELKIWRGPKIPYPFSMDTMISDLVLENLSKTPERILQITRSDDKAITCNEFKISMIRVAQNLAKIGIKEEDVVGIIARQSHLASYIINGCIALGALINPLHAAMNETDICGIFNQTRPKIIICEFDIIPKVQWALKNVDFSYQIYSMSNENSELSKAEDFLKPTDNEDNFKLPRFKKPANEKIFAILCSSGTTGMSKGVCFSHSSLLSLISEFPKTTYTTVSYTTSPIYWATGFFPNITSVLLQNELRIVYEDKQVEIREIFEDIEKYGITSASITPTLLALILQDENIHKYNLKSLQSVTSGGSIVSKTLRDKFAEIFPDKVMMVPYGLTEVFVSMTKPNEYKQEYAVGSLLSPHSEVKVVDDDGNRLGIDERGEILIKTPYRFVKYYNNAEATSIAFDNEGFIKTGDIGYFNKEGILFVIDRKKDILKYKGHQINPSEIENVIQEIEGVNQVSVVGILDDFVGNFITAAIVKKHGYESLTKDEIMKHVARRLPEYKHLHGGVFFFDKLPMTPSGKIQKRFVIENILKIMQKFSFNNKM